MEDRNLINETAKLCAYYAEKISESILSLDIIANRHNMWEHTADGNKSKEIVEDAEYFFESLLEYFSKISEGMTREEIIEEKEKELKEFMNDNHR